MNAPSGSLVQRALGALARAVCARPGWFVWPQLVLFAAAVAFTVLRLEFHLNRNALVGEDKVYHRIFLELRREFPGQDDIVVVAESEDPEKNRQFVERLGARLGAESVDANPTNLFTDVFYKGDLTLLGRKALLFSPETNLVEFSRALEEYRPFLDDFAGATNLAAVLARVNARIRASGRPGEGTGAEADPAAGDSADASRFAAMLPALDRLVRMASDALRRPGPPPSPGVEALFGGGARAEGQKYITLGGGRLYLVSTKPRLVDHPDPDRRLALQASVNGAAIRRLRVIVDEVRREVPGLNVGVTGEQVLDHDEMRQSQVDSTRAAVLALILCAGIFVAAYHETGRPLKAIACLVIGLGYTMGYTTLVVGHLNILTITFAPMLIGLAVDFGVHLVTRFEEECRRGLGPEAAMERAVVYTGQGIFTGCFTTAGAFFAMAFTEFKGVREMGLITGGGMLLCLVPMITLLPVLLLRRGRQLRIESAGSGDAVSAGGRLRGRMERLWLDRPWTVLGVAVLVSALAAVRVGRVPFDYNLLHMQTEGLPAVEFEHKLIASSEKSVLYAAVTTGSLAEAAAMEERIAALPTVASIDSMTRFLREDPERKLAEIRRIRAALDGLEFAPVDPGPADLRELSLRLFALQGYLALAAEALEAADPGEDRDRMAAEVGRLREAVADLRAGMTRGDPEVNARQLGRFQRAFLSDLHGTLSAVRNQDTSGALTVDDLPPALRNRFVGRSGRHLLQVYPKGDVWERDEQEAFVRELRTVTDRVTGTPVQLYEYTTLLKDSYVEAAWWALAAICVLTLIHFRSPVQVLLALLPVALGAFWMVGLMGWVGIPFNPANIMTLPLVIGIGVTNGIHILNRFGEEADPAVLGKSTGKAVLVSGLTTIAGFGALITGEHQGIRSLGWVMSSGTLLCMTAALTVLPAVLMLGRRSGPADPAVTPSP